MLNEIIKGMDNAAEAINENFEKLDSELVVDGNNYYVKFENGFQVCWAIAVGINQDIGASGGSYTKPFSAPFVGRVAVGFSAAYSVNSHARTQGLDTLTAHGSSDLQEWQLRSTSNTAVLNNDLILWAFGRWK